MGRPLVSLAMQARRALFASILKQNLGVVISATAAVVSPALLCGDVATYTSAVNGNWTDPTKWLTNPYYPTQDNPTGTIYDAVIDATGSAYGISLLSDVKLKSLTINSADASINHNDGWLEADTINILAGTYNLQYGKVRNSTFQSDTGNGRLEAWVTTPVMNNCTLNMDMYFPYGGSQLGVQNGITLNNHAMRFTSLSSDLVLNGSGIYGTGELILNTTANTTGGGVKIWGGVVGPGITIKVGTVATNVPAVASLLGVENRGTINSTNTNQTTIFDDQWTNNGTINLSNGTLLLQGSFRPSDIGVINRTGGTIFVNGTVNNTGTTLATTASTGSWNLGQTNSATNGQIIGGRIETRDGTLMRVPGFVDFSLTNTTLAGTIQMNTSAEIRLFDKLTMDSGTVLLTCATAGAFQQTEVSNFGATSITGTGEFVFQGGDVFSYVNNYIDNAVFGPGINFRADTGGGTISNQASAPLIIQGKITAGARERKITLSGPINLQGTLQIDLSGDVPALNLANLSGGTLTGGTFIINNGAKLRLASAITTNAASISLVSGNSNIFVGASGSVSALANLTTNAVGASFSLSGGRSITFTGNFNNNGTLVVGGGSTLTDTSGITNGSTGVISGAGIVAAPITNNGVISPGSSPGTLTVNGAVTLTGAGRVNMELGGTSSGLFDRLVVNGALTFGGVLNVTLVNGYLPLSNGSFDLFDFTSASGSFSQINLPDAPGGKEWDTTKLYTTGVISIIPEPGTMSIIVGVAASTLIRRHRARSMPVA